MAWVNRGLYGNQTLTNNLEDLEEYLAELEAIVNLLAPKSRSLTAGNGLLGGGDLSADRTFDVGAGTGISVDADSVNVDYTVLDLRYSLTSHNHNGVYASYSHNHDSWYAAIGHNHSGVYEPVDASILRTTDVDSTPLSGEWTIPVSTGWAYAHITAADPHTGYVLESAVTSTATNGSMNPISSDWAYDHEAAADPHTGYVLESNVQGSPVSGSSHPVSAGWAYTHNFNTLDPHSSANYAKCNDTETISSSWVFSAYPRVTGLYIGNDTDVMLYPGDGNMFSIRCGPSTDYGYARFVSSSGLQLQFNTKNVLRDRITGWYGPTGTATRTSFATSTVTLPQLAERVKALIDDLMTHGMIGTT